MFFTPFRTFPHFAKHLAALYPATNASRKSYAPAKTTPASLSWFLQGHSFCYGWLAVPRLPYIFFAQSLATQRWKLYFMRFAKVVRSMFFTPFRTFPHFAKRRAAPCSATNASAKAMPPQKPRQQSCHGFCKVIAFAKAGLLC